MLFALNIPLPYSILTKKGDRGLTPVPSSVILSVPAGYSGSTEINLSVKAPVASVKSPKSGDSDFVSVNVTRIVRSVAADGARAEDTILAAVVASPSVVTEKASTSVV